MKKKYFVLAVLVILPVVLFSLKVYAEKEENDDKVMLPEAVASSVQSLYPQAAIEEVKKDRESILLYEIEVKQDGAEMELSIAPDGTVVEEEQEIRIQDLPQVIQDAIAGGEVEEVTREVTYYVVTLTKLDTPQVSYTIEFEQDGTESEIEFAPDGSILKQEIDDDDDDEGHEHQGNNTDDDEDDDEDDD